MAFVNVHAARRVAAGRAGQFAPADVAAELFPAERDFAGGLIGPGAGLFQIHSGRGHAEHASAGGDNRAVRFRRARMKKAHARVGCGPIESSDRVAGFGFFRIATRGQHHGAGGFVAPADRGFCQTSLDTCQNNLAQRGGEQGQQGLGLGVSEAAVVFDQLGSVGG